MSKIIPVTDLSVAKAKYDVTGHRAVSINFWDGESPSENLFILPPDLARKVGRWLIRNGWCTWFLNIIHGTTLKQIDKKYRNETVAQRSD